MAGKETKKVFVGLSGGVDSSLSAALLQKEGYEVTGVFMKTWHPDFLPCTWKEDRLDAMRVAAHLGIPFLTFEFESEYKNEVAEHMINEYRQGRTPNPDVLCNSQIKFGAFLKRSLEMGADFIATGHYAQKKFVDGSFKLFAGADREKDQSYFLWTLSQEKLKHILFPVGHLQKSQVRALAREFSLPTAERKESQGICFLGALNMRDFLQHYIEPEMGNVIDETGRVIGTHKGAFFSTFGQRHGFTITEKEVSESPYYVVSKDLSANTLTVSHLKTKNARSQNELSLENEHWISTAPQKGKLYSARFHYRQALQDCTIQGDTNNVKIIFITRQEPFAPGQSLVLYDGEVCLGGGIIRSERG